ncbi:MAG: PspA/IM30 family protein [Chloroflexota bacterium]
MFDFLRRLFGAEQTTRRNQEAQADPHKILAQAVAGLEADLAEAQRSLRAVEATRRALETRRAGLRQGAEEREWQAERALAVGREDLAKQALAMAQGARQEEEEVAANIAEVVDQQAGLESARDSLQRRLTDLRARRAELAGRLAAATAELQTREAVADDSANSAAVARAMEQIEDRVEGVQARAGALGELDGRGGGAIGGADALEGEIRTVERARRVERELARVRQEALARRGKHPNRGEQKG